MRILISLVPNRPENILVKKPPADRQDHEVRGARQDHQNQRHAWSKQQHNVDELGQLVEQVSGVSLAIVGRMLAGV